MVGPLTDASPKLTLAEPFKGCSLVDSDELYLRMNQRPRQQRRIRRFRQTHEATPLQSVHVVPATALNPVFIAITKLNFCDDGS